MGHRGGGFSSLDAKPRDAAQAANELQRKHVEGTRRGIPLLFGGEALLGFKVRDAPVFPDAIAQAATWQPELIEEMADTRSRGAGGWDLRIRVPEGVHGVANLSTLDMFRVAMLARIGQQLVEATPAHNRNGVGPEEPLAVAIVGGSRAMGLSAHTGSLEIGKRADVVLIGMDSPDAAGYASPEAFLYECASGRDVTTVIVDGQLVVDGGELLTIDVADVRARAIARQRVLMDAIA